MPSPRKKSGFSFKFEAYWEAHLDCHQVIRDGWVHNSDSEDMWKNLKGCMTNCKNELLQRWQKRVFRRADVEILNLKEKLKKL